jgi:arsenate reductase
MVMRTFVFLILGCMSLALAGADPAPAPKLKILFVCTGNSCRSQMAEGWTRKLHGDRFEAYSGGTKPKGMVMPLAIQAMAEAGVDISAYTSKRITDLGGMKFDYVVTVCGRAAETCPYFPAALKVIHVGFDDPPALAQTAPSEAEALAHYRRVRDEIRVFVQYLPEVLAALPDQQR